MTKGPASSVIPADVSMNPMADPPNAPHKVYAHNTVLTLVSTNFSLHYRSTTPMLVCDFSYCQVLSQVWQEMDQSLTSQQEEEINSGFRHPDPLPTSMQISPTPKCPIFDPSLFTLSKNPPQMVCSHSPSFIDDDNSNMNLSQNNSDENNTLNDIGTFSCYFNKILTLFSRCR